MFILTLHWDFRLLLASLTVTARFYTFGLMVAAVYSTYCAVRIGLSLRRVSKEPITDFNDVRIELFEMANRAENLRQLHALLFLLFGVCCGNEAVAILRAIQYSSASLSAARMDIFEPVTAFAFFVFAVLLVLHIFQWAVAVRLRAAFRTNMITLY